MFSFVWITNVQMSVGFFFVTFLWVVFVGTFSIHQFTWQLNQIAIHNWISEYVTKIEIHLRIFWIFLLKLNFQLTCSMWWNSIKLNVIETIKHIFTRKITLFQRLLLKTNCYCSNKHSILSCALYNFSVIIIVIDSFKKKNWICFPYNSMSMSLLCIFVFIRLNHVIKNDVVQVNKTF